MLSLQRISKAIALALALGAFAAPVASAEAIGGSGQVMHHPFIHPSLRVARAGDPFAGNPFANPFAPIAGYSPQDKRVPTAASVSLARHADPHAFGTRVPLSHVASAPAAAALGDGFDWADAGIGAAGCVAIVAIGAGLVLVERRPRRTQTTAVATG
jgi:hypothetical protein